MLISDHDEQVRRAADTSSSSGGSSGGVTKGKTLVSLTLSRAEPLMVPSAVFEGEK